jgi:hypothetical protein
MNENQFNEQFKRNTRDQLAKSLERISIYNSKGQGGPYKLPVKLDLEKVLGNLDLETIDLTMFVKKRAFKAAGTGSY